MAREKDFEERRREREREEREREREQEEAAALAKKRPGHSAALDKGDGSVERFLELLGRAEPLIEQVNALYNQYLSGVERRAPAERRQQLDQLMMTLQTMSKPTQALQFRFNTLNASYATFRERWDRMCKDLESGKRKPVR
jgi:hypothetical protein